MNFRFCLSVLLAASLVFTPRPGTAQNAGDDGTLHILRPSINTGQDTAELCLEFDRPLDLSSRTRLASAIQLETNGKQVPVSASNISVMPTLLCVQSLAYRQNYHLTVSALRGAHGEKLNAPYRFSFTAPDRSPSLAFEGDPGASGLIRAHGEDPVLRAVNVPRVHVMLYRLTDPAHIAEAFRQRMQTAIAPTESLTFAKTNGQLVWEDDLSLDEEDENFANQAIDEKVPLHDALGTLPPGFYFIAAQAPERLAVKKKKRKNETDLPPTAAAWFIRSDLKITAIRGHNGFFVTAENEAASAVAKGVHLRLEDRDQHVLAEGKTDTGGLSFLPLPDEKKNDAVILFGLTDQGDVDLADVSQQPDNLFNLPDEKAQLATGKPFYSPDATVYVTLSVRNIHNEAVATSGTLQVLYPDRSPFISIPVPQDKTGVAYVSFPAPAKEGSWPLVWQANSSDLAETVLRVSTNPLAPHVEISADRDALESDGAVALTIKTLTSKGEPAPYIAGHVNVQWAAPTTLTNWSDYHFGILDGTANNSASIPVAGFLTDTNGAAQLHVNLKPPNDGAPLHTALLTVESDKLSGAADPAPLALAVRPADFVVGVKPAAPNGKFAENSLARFNVIALDGSEHRAAVDLEYQIYEEGRDFAWYQAEGRWTYKALPQQRRIGGGALTVSAKDPARIEWPVTAGSYVLEIVDADGKLRMRYPFVAGWGLPQVTPAKSPALTLISDAPEATPGAETKLHFTLERPAMVTVIIGDDRLRKVIHKALPAGANEVTFMPEEDWGNRIGIWLIEGNASGYLELPVHHNQKELGVSAALPVRIIPGETLALPVTVSNEQGSAFVSALVVPETGGGIAEPESILLKSAQTGSDGKITLHVPVPKFSGALRVKILAVNQGQEGQKEITLPVAPALAVEPFLPRRLRSGDILKFSIDLRNNGAPIGNYHYTLSSTAGKISGAAGTVNLTAGQTKTLSFDLHAQLAGSREIKFDLMGPHDFRLAETWPLAVSEGNVTITNLNERPLPPQKSLIITEHEKTRARTYILLISPAPLFDAPKFLADFVQFVPFTTDQLAGWLETAHLWHAVITAAGLKSETALAAERSDFLMRLLQRQNTDGGFPSVAGGASDLKSTSAALSALASTSPAEQDFKPAVNQAAQWLAHQLANNWFDEKERPARAAAFAAMAASNHLDVAGLRYFAETSADKNLPPLAAAQLALALAKAGDQDKATQWLTKVRQHMDEASLLPILLANPLFNPQDAAPALQKISDALASQTTQEADATGDFLRALWILNGRTGAWRIAIDNNEKNQTGIAAIPLAEKTVIRNPQDRPLFTRQIFLAKALPAGSGIKRRLFRLDGSELSDTPIDRGQVYLVKIEGAWPEDAGRILVHDDAGSGLKPIDCALDDDGETDALQWVKSSTLVAPSSCEKNLNGIDALLVRGDTKTWQIAYLVRAEFSGAFTAPPTLIRSLGN